MRIFCAALAFLAFPLLAQTEAPKTWVDPDTGHRVVRLTDEPGSASLYFNQNGYTPDGKKLVYTTPNGIYTLDLATQRREERVVEGRVRLIEVGHKTPACFYTKAGAVFVTDTETGARARSRTRCRSAAPWLPSTPTKRCSPERTRKRQVRPTMPTPHP